MTENIIWQAVGVMITAMGISVTALGFYVRSLIDRHTLNCPYPKRFDEALTKLTDRLVSDEKDLSKHASDYSVHRQGYGKEH